MTIAEYIEYEEKMKRQNNRNPRSYFLTKYDDTNDYTFCPNTSKKFPNYSCDAKIDTYYNLPPLLPCFKPIQPYTEHRYESPNVEFIEEISYMLDGESVISEQEMSDNTSEPDLEPQDKGMSSDDDVDEWQIKTSEDDEVHEVSSMANNDTVGEDGSLSEPLPCQLPPRELRLGSFTLPYTIDMTQQEPLGTVENALVKIDKFVFPCNFVVIDISGILGEMMILGWSFLVTIHAQIDVFNGEISLGIGEYRIKFDVNGNSHSNVTIEKFHIATTSQEEESFNILKIKDDLFSYESPALVRIAKCGLHAILKLDSSFCSGYEAVYGKYKHGMLEQWVAQNYEFDNDTNPSTTASDKYPYNVHYPTLPLSWNPPSDEWHTKNQTTYDIGSTSDPSIPIAPKGDTNPFPQGNPRSNEKTNLEESPLFNEWMLDSFNIEAEYAKEFGDHTQEGKKGYVVDDVWEKYERYHGNTLYPWHDEGFEEDELWQSSDEKTDYEPPFVNIETFEVKKYSFKGGRSFICITKQLDDTLPLGRENGTRFKEMIRNELGGGENNQKET
ncbi:phospholipase-like protein [Tanacetum coccineum]